MQFRTFRNKSSKPTNKTLSTQNNEKNGVMKIKTFKRLSMQEKQTILLAHKTNNNNKRENILKRKEID